MKQVSLDELSVQQLRAELHTKFQVFPESGEAVALELIALTPQSAGEAQFENFSLLFTGPADRPLDQRTYRFGHEHLGTFDLFIVPVGVDTTGRQYEAVFNRRLPSR